MSETTGTNPGTDSGTTSPAPARKRSGGINSMLIAELKSMAGGLGIPGSGSMKKAQLVEAIKAHQAGQGAAPAKQAPAKQTQTKQAPTKPAPAKKTAPAEVPAAETPVRAAKAGDSTEKSADTPSQDAPSQKVARAGRGEQQTEQKQKQAEQKQGNQQQADQKQADQKQAESSRRSGRKAGDQRQSGQRDEQRQSDRDDRGQQQKQGQQQGQQKQNQQQNQQKQQQNQQGQQRHGDKQDRGSQVTSGDEGDDFGDDEGGSRRNRRRRGRERSTTRTTGRSEPDTTILEDDVLVPAAGILDVLDNYAFVRTSGYLPGTDDVYLSLSMVRKYGLRRGDALVGQVRQPREGERREKFNPMVRIDTVNGTDPENAKERAEFEAFTPVHPRSRLRLETGPDNMLGRIVDVVAPIGKGQRGLVLSPPRSGKTQVLRSIAEAIHHNNPECHVMVVLIDERPEEVTDYQQSIRGEVIASTFDRPAADHVLAAELAVERAKRLVELGNDVVVLLDSLTRLGRAYNVTGPTSGRVGQSGVDAVALHPAKKLFGAARNVEDGGSLTILATALVESGSPLDEAVLDEFNDTYNMELRLRRELAERRLYPPVDVVSSGTRREEHLLAPEEEQITWKLRTALMDLDPTEALDRVLTRMGSSQNNIEFLTKVQQATSEELASR